MTEAARKRPEFRNLNVFKDLTTYRLPWAAKVSILHRISGVLMILMLPFIIWLFDKSISSEISFTKIPSLSAGNFPFNIDSALAKLMYAK